MKKLQISFIFIVFCVMNVMSQNFTGIGKVISGNGLPVPNATIEIYRVGIDSIVYPYTCDSAGEYSFDIPDMDTSSSTISTFTREGNKVFISSGGSDHSFIIENSKNEIQNISIFDIYGHEIRKIKVKNSGSELYAYWNGCDNNGNLANDGIYVFSSTNNIITGKFAHFSQGNRTGSIQTRALPLKSLKEIQDLGFVFTVKPSVQTLQFLQIQENHTLIIGNNGQLIHQVSLFNSKGLVFRVVDSSGNPVDSAEVILYDTKRKWRIDSCRLAVPYYTNINGEVMVNALLPQEYWFNVYKGNLHNRFTTKSTGVAIDTSVSDTITVLIRPLSAKEILLCGSDNKTWITTGLVIFGDTSAYDADSRLLSDGTWSDSNGRSGFWWFNANETWLTYDYDVDPGAAPMVVDCQLLELTEFFFKGKIDNFNGLPFPVIYLMEAIYD